MPYSIPGTKELVERNLANIESSLNQNTPLAEKAFNRVLAATSGMADKELYRFAEDLVRENLALTASESGLVTLGEEYGAYRVLPTVWEGKVSFDLPDGETLHYGTIFISPFNLKYEVTESATAPYLEPGSGVVVSITCADAGPSGNLSFNDILAIQKPLSVAGAGRTAKVVEVLTLGVPVEDLEAYRQRVLDITRAEGGGGNSSDYRQWAQAVSGVRRAYPFSGPPEHFDRKALPGERTVYIECTVDLNSDGIPPQSLLEIVHSALLTNPFTGESRIVLGITEDSLYVEPIVRTGLYINIGGMAVTAGHIGDAQEAIRSSMDLFAESFKPFVPGLDPDFDRQDTITASVIGREVQNVLDTFGGSAQNVSFGILPGHYIGKYVLKRNEKIKIAEIIFQEAKA